ncbi:MAG: hypothetical protein QW548_02785 [Candidatus Aenigmatarchaeota archaeon]
MSELDYVGVGVAYISKALAAIREIGDGSLCLLCHASRCAGLALGSAALALAAYSSPALAQDEAKGASAMPPTEVMFPLPQDAPAAPSGEQGAAPSPSKEQASPKSQEKKAAQDLEREDEENLARMAMDAYLRGTIKDYPLEQRLASLRSAYALYVLAEGKRLGAQHTRGFAQVRNEYSKLTRNGRSYYELSDAEQRSVDDELAKGKPTCAAPAPPPQSGKGESKSVQKAAPQAKGRANLRDLNALPALQPQLELYNPHELYGDFVKAEGGGGAGNWRARASTGWGLGDAWKLGADGYAVGFRRKDEYAFAETEKEEAGGCLNVGYKAFDIRGNVAASELTKVTDSAAEASNQEIDELFYSGAARIRLPDDNGTIALLGKGLERTDSTRITFPVAADVDVRTDELGVFGRYDRKVSDIIGLEALSAGLFGGYSKAVAKASLNGSQVLDEVRKAWMAGGSVAWHDTERAAYASIYTNQGDGIEHKVGGCGFFTMAFPDDGVVLGFAGSYRDGAASGGVIVSDGSHAAIADYLKRRFDLGYDITLTAEQKEWAWQDYLRDLARNVNGNFLEIGYKEQEHGKGGAYGIATIGVSKIDGAPLGEIVFYGETGKQFDRAGAALQVPFGNEVDAYLGFDWKKLKEEEGSGSDEKAWSVVGGVNLRF